MVQKGGLKAHSASLLVLAAPNSHGHARLGVTVSKKVDKRAVHRNRLRRMLKTTFRQNRSAFEPADWVVIAKPAALHAEPSALTHELLRGAENLSRRLSARGTANTP